jgi:hypothetical protein
MQIDLKQTQFSSFVIWQLQFAIAVSRVNPEFPAFAIEQGVQKRTPHGSASSSFLRHRLSSGERVR